MEYGYEGCYKATSARPNCGQGGVSFEAIGKELGVSHQHALSIYNKALQNFLVAFAKEHGIKLSKSRAFEMSKDEEVVDIVGELFRELLSSSEIFNEEMVKQYDTEIN